jgi:putative Holliday junction resolvase
MKLCMTISARHKTKSPEASVALSGRILAVDYGRRRLGLALSDDSGLLARPLETLEPGNRAERLRLIREAVRQHRPARIVVGLPLRLDGTRGEMAEEAARFARRIEKETGLPVELADERLSSWQAEEIAAGKPRSRRADRTGRSSSRRAWAAGAPKDHLAAAVFLQDFLDRRRAAQKAAPGSAGN